METKTDRKASHHRWQSVPWFLINLLFVRRSVGGALCYGLCVGGVGGVSVHKHLISISYRTNTWVDWSDFSVAYWGSLEEGSFQWSAPPLIQDGHLLGWLDEGSCRWPAPIWFPSIFLQTPKSTGHQSSVQIRNFSHWDIPNFKHTARGHMPCPVLLLFTNEIDHRTWLYQRQLESWKQVSLFNEIPTGSGHVSNFRNPIGSIPWLSLLFSWIGFASSEWL
jgi:hypothetical protein